MSSNKKPNRKSEDAGSSTPAIDDEVTYLPDGVSFEAGTVDDLKDDPNQMRRHTGPQGERGVELIADSLRKVGTGRSVVADTEKVLIAGHGTKEAAKRVGITKTLLVKAPADTLIVRVVDGLTGQDKLFMAASDNRANELSEWEPQAVQRAIDAGMPWESMWTPDEIAPIVHADWAPKFEDENLPGELEKPKGTAIQLSKSQLALVRRVQKVVDDELEGSEEVTEGKAIEYACKLFLSQREPKPEEAPQKPESEQEPRETEH